MIVFAHLYILGNLDEVLVGVTEVDGVHRAGGSGAVDGAFDDWDGAGAEVADDI